MSTAPAGRRPASSRRAPAKKAASRKASPQRMAAERRTTRKTAARKPTVRKTAARKRTPTEEPQPRRLGRKLLIGALSTTTFLVLVAGVVPVRQYLEQQRRLDSARQRIELLDEQNRRLAARASELKTDEEIERLAREQYSLVRPGEEAFALLPGSDEKRPAQAPLESPDPVEPPEPSWLERLLDAIAFWD